MNRLLQGDVGSGKTIVALLSIYANKLAGYQSEFLAPTEILATQHYENTTKQFTSHVKLSNSKKHKNPDLKKKF